MLKFAVVTAPLAMIAVWGGSYLLDCFHSLEAPGVPFEFSFQTKSGELTVTAQSYTIAAGRGTVIFSKPKLQDSHGTVLAQLDKLELTGLSLTRGSDQIIRVRGRNLVGRLTRMKDGRFDLQDYLPQQAGAGNESPFDVEIEGSKVTFVDMTAGTPWSRLLSSRKIKVAGLGQDWVASAQVDLEGIGQLDTRVQNIKDDGLRISGSSQSLELSKVLSHFAETPDGRKFSELSKTSFDSVTVRGPILVFIPKGKDPNVEVNADVSAKGVRYGKYDVASGSFVGMINANGLSGTFDFLDGESTATLRGSAAWRGTPSIAGDLSISAPNSQGLPKWINDLIPRGTSFQNASFHGWLSGKSPDRYHISGEVEAVSATITRERFDDLTVGVELGDERVVLQVKRGVCSNGPITGMLDIDPKKHTVFGFATGSDLDLEGLSSGFGFKQISGRGSVSAIVTGDISHPNVEFETHGQGVASIQKEHTISLGTFEGAGSYGSGGLNLSQASFNTAYGLLTGHGSMSDSGILSFDVSGRGIQPAEYDPRVSGAANLTARITGPIKNPLVVGHVEASDLAYRTSNSIQALTSNFRIDKSHAEFTQLEAVRGTMSLSGNGQVKFRTGEIQGAVSALDIQIAEWLGNEYVGAVDVPDIHIQGTLDHPLAVGHLSGSSLVTKGVKLDNLSADLKLNGSVLSADALKVTGGGGLVTGSGVFDLNKREGEVSAKGADIDLQTLHLLHLLPAYENTIAIGGKLSAEATFKLAGGNLVDVAAKGTLDSFSINKSNLGSGQWQANWTNQILSGNLEVGAMDRFLELSDLVLDTDSKRIKGQLNALNFKLEDIIERTIPSFPDLSFDIQNNLLALKGQVSLGCSFDGTLADPAVDVSSLQFKNLVFNQQPVGELNSQFRVKDHKWQIDSVELSKGPATFAMKGTIDEHGEIHLDATNDNRFDLTKLSHFDSRLSRLTGTADLWISADGPTKSPKIRASLTVNNLFAPPGIPLQEKVDDKYLRLELDKIVIDPTNAEFAGISVGGAYFYKGFHGTIDAHSPFEYPFQFPADRPVDATISFEKSDLKEIADIVGGFLDKGGDGTVEGKLKVQGNSNALSLAGGINLKASSISIIGVDDYANNVVASLALTPGTATVQVNGTASKGGNISLNASAPLAYLGELQQEVQNVGLAGLLDRPISGTASLTAVQFKQIFDGQSTISGKTTSSVAVSGTIRNPKLSGDINLSSGDVVFKGFPVAKTRTDSPWINPTFDIKLAVKDHTRLRSSTADMTLAGQGTLKGTLDNPKMQAVVTLEKGSVRLPAALLRLDQGGTVKIDYGIQSPRAASAVVDLEGNTSVTASRYGDLDVQRYDISLAIKGDLLQDKGLNLTASSDPPDLSQERIMGILGETDLLQSLSYAGKENTAVQAALLSTVPTLLDPWTGQIAQGLGLDYLNLEYSAFDQASVTFGKILGSGLTVEGNRQLSEPPPGFAARYDLRILYRPRRLPGAFHQFRFFFGADQDRPWKLGVEYGVRF